jgi:hypothetical protein
VTAGGLLSTKLDQKKKGKAEMSAQNKKTKSKKSSKVTVVSLKDIKPKKNPRAGKVPLAASQIGMTGMMGR